MVTSIPSEKMAEYRQGLGELLGRRAETRRTRLERAWEVARRVASLLKSEYGITRVAVFGSALRPAYYLERSDLDLAVWGLDPARYLEAVSAIEKVAGGIPVDLIEFERTEGVLRSDIEQYGQEV